MPLVNSIDQIIEESKKPLPGDVERIVARDVGSSLHYYRFLHALAKEVKPDLMVELGTWKGTSAACLADGNPAGRVVTIELFPRVLEEEVKRLNIEHLIMDSMDDSFDLRNVDILFIDTEHDGLRPRAEYDFWLPRMSKNNIILLDDINLNDEMRAFWAELATPGEKIELPIHGEAGFGLILNQGY